MQDGADVELDRVVRTPVGGDFDLVCPPVDGVGHHDSDERLAAHPDRRRVSRFFQRVDDSRDQVGELVPSPPTGEQIDVAARATTDAVCLDGVATCERKPVRSSRSECDSGDPFVVFVHEF